MIKIALLILCGFIGSAGGVTCASGYIQSEGYCLPVDLGTSRVLTFETGETIAVEASPSYFGILFENDDSVSGFVSETKSATACEELENGYNVFGRIALVNRGICTFETKALAAVEAGAIAVIIAESSSDNIQLDFLFPNVCLKEADIDVPVVYLKWTNAEYLRTRLSKDPDLVVSISSRGKALGEDCIIPDDCRGYPTLHTCNASKCTCNTPSFKLEKGLCVKDDLNALKTASHRDTYPCSVVPVGGVGCHPAMSQGRWSCSKSPVASCKSGTCVCPAGYQMEGQAGTVKTKCRRHSRQRLWERYSPKSSQANVLTSLIKISRVECAVLCFSRINCASFDFSTLDGTCHLIRRGSDHTQSGLLGADWLSFRGA